MVFAVIIIIAAHLNIHKIVQGPDRLTVDFFHGFMVSVEICSRWIFLCSCFSLAAPSIRYPSIFRPGIFFCQQKTIYRSSVKDFVFERILPRQTTSGTLEPTWEMIPWRAPLHGPWLRESKELQWYWIRKCNLSQVTWPNAQRKSCVAQNLCPKPKDLLCWGVWCLFEFFLSSRQHLDLAFVTTAGVVGGAAWRKQVCLSQTARNSAASAVSMKQ